MRVERPVAGSKGLMQRVEAMIRATLPRQARVTRTEGNAVYVRMLGEKTGDPESRFVSTVAGVPVATMGWVITLGGKKGLFIATGISLPIPFTAHSGNSSTTLSTTSTSAFSYRTMKTMQVPAGTYRVSAVATIPTSRSVSTGEIWALMRVGGVESTHRGGNLGSTFLNLAANQLFPMMVNMDDQQITVDEDGSVLIEVGIRGGTTAGTTTARMISVHGTITRI